MFSFASYTIGINFNEPGSNQLNQLNTWPDHGGLTVVIFTLFSSLKKNGILSERDFLVALW